MSKYLVVVDYNLTRFFDVKLMTDYAKEKYDAETILIRPNPQSLDHEVASVVLDLDPRHPQFLDEAMKSLAPYRDSIQAVMPFSDNAVATGARLAELLGKNADSSLLARNAYSKLSYREAEQALKPVLEAQRVFVPRFQKVTDWKDVEEFARQCPNGFVLKPSCEGNNRGVLRLDAGADLVAAFEEVKMYLEEGLICEELIPFSSEFSFDGIGSLNFITEKMSLSTRYPVEKGQMVPARVSLRQRQAIERAGRAANLIVGQADGPFHNEVKLDLQTLQSAVIEPNRRPAGMKIWHLAERVYGVNFFKLWIDQLLGHGIIPNLPQPKGVAAILELSAPFSGVLSRELNDPHFVHEFLMQLTDGLADDLKVSDFRFTQAGGARVDAEPKDNAGFIAEVCLFSEDLYIDLEKTIRSFESRFHAQIATFIQAEEEVMV